MHFLFDAITSFKKILFLMPYQTCTIQIYANIRENFAQVDLWHIFRITIAHQGAIVSFLYMLKINHEYKHYTLFRGI